jgi:DNA-binding MarR family transcriptional regulator
LSCAPGRYAPAPAPLADSVASGRTAVWLVPGQNIVLRCKCNSLWGTYDIIRGMKTLTLSDYESLAELRFQIRLFLANSERAARAVGLEPRQHQLMLALKGLSKEVRPCIRELAPRLHIQHHSAVELVNRLAKAGYIRRQIAGQDRRLVLLSLTPRGEKVLRELSLYHRDELRSTAPTLVEALRRATRQAGKPSRSSLRISRTRSGSGRSAAARRS